MGGPLDGKSENPLAGWLGKVQALVQEVVQSFTQRLEKAYGAAGLNTVPERAALDPPGETRRCMKWHFMAISMRFL